MKITTLQDLYVHELQDLHSAEKQLVKALPKMAAAARSQDLKAAFESHLLETKEHVNRLERLLALEGAGADGPSCKAMKGLVAEGEALIAETADPEVGDAGLIGAAQKVEHYEMAGYGTVRNYARILGKDEAAAVLQTTLDEEGAADKKLTGLAVSAINSEAAGQAAPDDGSDSLVSDDSRKTAHTKYSSLKGKRVLVTGGTTGLGRAIALRLSAEGARVLIFGRHQAELDDALKDIRKNDPQAIGMLADSSKAEDLEKVFETVKTGLGGLDILINNAAVAADGLEETPDAEREYALLTNISAYLRCCKLAMEMMPEFSDIVLIGSVSADERSPGGSIYVATKGAIQAFAESFRQEALEKGIRVSLVEPARTGSDMIDQNVEEQREAQKKLEILKAEDVAVGVEYILTQDPRCTVAQLVLRPSREKR
ncbi:MAG: DUF892 family protein [Verrucomicrobiota bacterium]